MQIKIEGDNCWKCGEAFTADRPRTTHHALPQWMKPKMNVLIPLHENCHEIVTSNDMGSMTAFAMKLKLSTDELNKRVAILTKMLKVE
jgi:hypothetical protein